MYACVVNPMWSPVMSSPLGPSWGPMRTSKIENARKIDATFTKHLVVIQKLVGPPFSNFQFCHTESAGANWVIIRTRVQRIYIAGRYGLASDSTSLCVCTLHSTSWRWRYDADSR